MRTHKTQWLRIKFSQQFDETLAPARHGVSRSGQRHGVQTRDVIVFEEQERHGGRIGGRRQRT
jgi:hypothetical protein